jgi:hypothetical protein
VEFKYFKLVEVSKVLRQAFTGIKNIPNPSFGESQYKAIDKREAKREIETGKIPDTI